MCGGATGRHRFGTGEAGELGLVSGKRQRIGGSEIGIEILEHVPDLWSCHACVSQSFDHGNGVPGTAGPPRVITSSTSEWKSAIEFSCRGDSTPGVYMPETKLF